jgi:hypothetical protein
MSEQPTKDALCADCAGFDIEWMYMCHTHKVEFCRGCACPYCAEDDYDDCGEDTDVRSSP